MEIREIKIEDYENLVLFWKENYFVNDMDSKDKFSLFLDKNPNLSILTEENGEIIGTALGSFDGRRGYVQKIVVKKDLRKKGIGEKLVEEVLKRLRAVGVTYVPIAVDSATISFYEKCGFKISGATAMNINFSSDKSYEEYAEFKK